MRVALNNVTDFALGADEGTYVRNTTFLFTHGWGSYADMLREYLATPGQWIFPDPLRWGWYALTTFASHLAGASDARVLANLSTLAGIISLLLTYLIARELLGEKAALFAGALAVTSPLQLQLGRRALQDETLCAVTLLVIWIVARIYARANALTRSALRWHYAAAIAAATLMLAIKESSALLLPAILIFLVAGRRRVTLGDLLLAVLPPALFFLGFAIFAHSFGAFFRVVEIVHSVQSAPYAEQYQNGPPHRLLLDFVSLSPIVVMLAIAAMGAATDDDDRTMKMWTLLVVLTVLPFAFASKNLRYVIMLDPMLRIAAAAFLARRRMLVAIAFLAASAAAEAWIFSTVFLAGEVYDPVTGDILEALKMIPH